MSTTQPVARRRAATGSSSGRPASPRRTADRARTRPRAGPPSPAPTPGIAGELRVATPARARRGSRGAASASSASSIALAAAAARPEHDARSAPPPRARRARAGRAARAAARRRAGRGPIAVARRCAGASSTRSSAIAIAHLLVAGGPAVRTRGDDGRRPRGPDDGSPPISPAVRTREHDEAYGAALTADSTAASPRLCATRRQALLRERARGEERADLDRR